ncbi:hypothetical protein BVRB_9g208650 [Beta vulgaris subsp. vulgaris]|nr:hypothetical protein BVRB_9g208650 [Beta vulgaris subsp. vulgaris]
MAIFYKLALIPLCWKVGGATKIYLKLKENAEKL